MAETKGALFAKTVQKHAGRAKEKILQNLGKVDKTEDEIFDEHLQNFQRQQNAASKLQKEFNNYIRCIRAVQTASTSLMDAIGEVYENQWTGHDVLCQNLQVIDMLWQDFSHKLGDQVLIPLNTYQAQFPEMRKKIDKRGRKLVDYDSQRHNFQGLQTNSNKKRDDVKVTRAREQLEEAKRTYELLNSELHDELPALYDSRVLFLVTNLQTLFSSEQIFHSETAKVFEELESVVDRLATESQRGSYAMKKALSQPVTLKSFNSNNKINSTPSSPPTQPKQNGSEAMGSSHAQDDASSGGSASPPPPLPTSALPEPQYVNGNNEKRIEDGGTVQNGHSSPTNDNKTNNNTDHVSKSSVTQIYDIPTGATTDNLPAGVLYRVKATYRYTKEDDDELSLEVGDIVRVIEYEDPDEQEDGWLMGIKEGTDESGIFPANFTRPI